MRRLLAILPALALALALGGEARAQSSDQKLDTFKDKLKLPTFDIPTSVRDEAGRKKYADELKAAADELKTLQQLARGLVEAEWTDISVPLEKLSGQKLIDAKKVWDEIARIQKDVYTSLENRLLQVLKNSLSGDSKVNARVTALFLLELSDPEGLRDPFNTEQSDRARATAGRLVVQLPALLNSDDPVVNQTVGTILARDHTGWGNAKTTGALEALLLQRPEPIRLHTAQQLNLALTRLTEMRRVPIKPLADNVFLPATTGILPVLGKAGPQEPVPVRRAVFRGIQLLSASLANDAAGRGARSEPGATDKLRAEFATQVKGPISKALFDSDVAVRWLSRVILEDLARASYAPQTRDDPLGKAMKDVVTPLRRGLTDDNIRSRLSAVEALGAMGVNASDAGEDLAARVRDSDRFVRWAAARALADILGPAPKDPDAPGDPVTPPKGAVEALAWLLSDVDPALRTEAAQTLKRYGPAARAAVPALARDLDFGDIDPRVAQLQALARIGDPAAIPGVTKALSLTEPTMSQRFGTPPAFVTDPPPSSVKVRQEAVKTLGKLGVPAREALEKALEDPEPEVRRAAATSLLELLEKK